MQAGRDTRNNGRGRTPECGLYRLRIVRSTKCCGLGLYEDALARALFGRLNDGIHLVIREARETLGTLSVPFRCGENLLALAHIGESVIEEDEDIGSNLFANSISGAEILIDPDLHGLCPFAV